MPSQKPRKRSTHSLVAEPRNSRVNSNGHLLLSPLATPSHRLHLSRYPLPLPYTHSLCPSASTIEPQNPTTSSQAHTRIHLIPNVVEYRRVSPHNTTRCKTVYPYHVTIKIEHYTVYSGSGWTAQTRPSSDQDSDMAQRDSPLRSGQPLIRTQAAGLNPVLCWLVALPVLDLLLLLLNTCTVYLLLTRFSGLRCISSGRACSLAGFPHGIRSHPRPGFKLLRSHIYLGLSCIVDKEKVYGTRSSSHPALLTLR